MPDEENYLKGVSNGAEVNVPQTLLDGNYIAYSSGPAAPTDEGVEGQFKTAPDGLYYYSSGLWRKVPAYTIQEQWDDLTTSVRFLQVDRDMELTQEERDRVRSVVGITVASHSTAGLVRPSVSTQSSGGVGVGPDGAMSVPYATSTAAGVVRITGDSTGQPVAASKGYVDALVGDGGSLAIAPATTTTIGGIRVGGDITSVTLDGYPSVARSLQLETDPVHTGTLYGLSRLAPSSLEMSPGDLSYEDSVLRGEGRQPYVATVSIARSIATHQAEIAAASIDYPVATGSSLGIAKGGAGITVTAGSFAVNEAVADGQRGTVLVAGTIPSGTGSDGKVPTVAAVKAYLSGMEYINDDMLQSGDYVSTSERYGVIKVNANAPGQGVTGLIIDDGTLSLVFPHAVAGGADYGMVRVTQSVTSGGALVPTAGAVYDHVTSRLASIPSAPYATDTTAGLVKVLKGSSDGSITPYTVPTTAYVSGDFLETSAFEDAVNALIRAHGTSWSGGTVTGPAEFEQGVTLDGTLTARGTATFSSAVTFGTAPQITSYAAKQSYDPKDVLTYTQVAALISGSGGLEWATYNPGSNMVTVSAGMTVTNANGVTAPRLGLTNAGVSAGSLAGSTRGLELTPVSGKSIVMGGMVVFSSDVVGTEVVGGATTRLAVPYVQVGRTSVKSPGAYALDVTGSAYVSDSVDVAGTVSAGRGLDIPSLATIQVIPDLLSAYNHRLYWQGVRIVEGEPEDQPYRAWMLVGAFNREATGTGDLLAALDNCGHIVSYVNNGVYGIGRPNFSTVVSGIVIHFETPRSYAYIRDHIYGGMHIESFLKSAKCSMSPAFIPDSW